MAKAEFGIKECAKCEYNLRCNECIYNNKDISKLIANAKAEVAREIFEEIEKEIDSVRGLNFALQSLDHFITELKKKYTEEK